MFEFTESVSIQAPRRKVWAKIMDLKSWWLPSNPEHISLQIRSTNDGVRLGTEIWFEERVAGIRGRARGTITTLIPEAEATWSGVAEYQYIGLRLPIEEGVSWRVTGEDNDSTLSAHVWARFPHGMFGKVLEWYSKSALHIVDRDRAHARQELEYLKAQIEMT